ncbi:MAG: hypothetical protein DRN28_01940 [Thermoplasmata archaeon]|nr:MAG: hypothetical protein DRN28_01940 [Thermoplasmata archaeon]
MVRVALVVDPRSDVIGALEELGALFEEMDVKVLLPALPEVSLPPGVLEDEEEREKFQQGFLQGLQAGIKRRIAEKWGEVEVVVSVGGTEWVLNECQKEKVAIVAVKAQDKGEGAVELNLEEMVKRMREGGIPLHILP